MRISETVKTTLFRLLKPRDTTVICEKTLPRAIYKPDRLGDFILASGAIKRLYEHSNGVQSVSLIVSKVVAPLAREIFPMLDLVTLPESTTGGFRDIIRNRRFLRTLRSTYHVEELVCLRHHRNIFESMTLNWLRMERGWAVAEPEDSTNSWPPPSLPTAKWSVLAAPKAVAAGVPDELLRHLTIVRTVLGQPEMDVQQVYPSLSFAGAEIGRDLLVSPYGSHPIRTYPQNLIATAISQFQQVSGVDVQLCGPRADAPRLQCIATHLARNGCSRVRVETTDSFADFVRKVVSARVVLTMETSTAHLATSLNKRTVVVIGGGHFGLFGPWQRSSRQIWVDEPITCRGCNWKCIHSEPLCITGISPERISRALAQVHIER